MKPGKFTYDKKRLYDALIKSTDDYIFIYDPIKKRVFFPKTLVEEFELPGQIIEDIDSVWGALIHPEDKSLFFSSFEDIKMGAVNIHKIDYRVKNRKGEWVWLRCRGYLEYDEKGNPSIFAGIIANLEKLNKLDNLTGLFNKFEFENKINIFIENKKEPIGVMLLDLDNFSHVNDLYDREFGDEIIRITAHKIHSLLPSNASLYKLDGNEFDIVIGRTSNEEIKEIYATIQHEFNHQKEFMGNRYYFTISAGCSISPENAKDFKTLYKFASYSLDFSKRSGKNCLNFFDKKTIVKNYKSLEIIELLRESIDNDFQGFEIYYQTQVDSLSRKFMGAEALLRWNCEKYGQVSPAEFIPLLEESGLIIPVGKWVFRQGVNTCKNWVEQNPNFIMNINLSYIQIVENDFPEFMKNVLKEEGVDPFHIIVELTESVLASNELSITNIFYEIRKIGILIAMDDFGTGYSSLGILKKIPADLVKIDKIFIKDIGSSTFDATFIKFIVALCHDMGIKVCLEGVETEEEYQIVKNMGLDLIQGYLFGKPQTKDVFCNTHFSICE